MVTAPSTTGMVRPTVIVTRPAREAAAWVQALGERGVPAVAQPLIEILPVGQGDAVQRLREARARMDAHAALMFVSANAVEGFLAPGVPLPTVPCWATGPGTAAALAAAGVPRARIVSPPADEGQFDSEALWRLIDPIGLSGREVLIVRGDEAGPDGATREAGGVGRDWLAQRLVQAGAQPRFVVSYLRRAPVLDEAVLDRLRHAQAAGAVWLFSSSEAVRNLPPQAIAAGARALATHHRIAQAARGRGLLVHECRPDVDDVVRSIESFA